MKRGIILLIIFILSINSVFAGDDKLCDIPPEFIKEGIDDEDRLYEYLIKGHRKYDIEKYINCYSIEDEKYINLLDTMFWYYLDSLIAGTTQNDLQDTIYIGNKGIDALEKHKNYDNYYYYLSKYSLYLSAAYSFPSQGIMFTQDLGKSDYFFNQYEKYKVFAIKRATSLLIDTSLSLGTRNKTEDVVDKSYNTKIAKYLLSLETNTQNKYISEMIVSINIALKKNNTEEQIYTLNHLKYLLQNKLYSNISNSYYNGNYVNTMSTINKYLDYFNYDENNLGTGNGRNEQYYKIIDLLFASFENELNKHYNSKDYNSTIQIGNIALESLRVYTMSGYPNKPLSKDYSLDKMQYDDYSYYLKVYSCILGDSYTAIGYGDLDEIKEYFTTCEQYSGVKRADRGGILLGR